jgi:hypothetical protein
MKRVLVSAVSPSRSSVPMVMISAVVMLGRIIQQGEWIIAYDGFESKIALRRFSGEARKGSPPDLIAVSDVL